MSNTQTTKLSMKEMKGLLDYKRGRKILRICGFQTLLCGGLVCAIGYRAGVLEGFSIDKIIKLVGIYLVIFGGLRITNPAPGGGLIVVGVCLVIVGVFMVVAWMAALLALPDALQVVRKRGGAIIPMLALIGTGVFNIVLFKRFSSTPMNMPSDETIRHMDDLVKFINKAKAKAKENSVIIEFTAGFENWKGMLTQESAVFVKGEGEDRIGDKAIKAASKDEVDCVKRGEVVIGKPIKVYFRIGKRKMKSTIVPELFERFEAWKARS